MTPHTTKPSTPEEYIAQVPVERRAALDRLRSSAKEYLEPLGFEERMSYGMIGYVVPFSTYPEGYHCDTSLPVPFVALGNQKKCLTIYHSGIYADEKLLSRFSQERKKHSTKKLDMGKSCIRLPHLQDIPYDLIQELWQKMTAKDYLRIYTNAIKK